MGSSTDIHDTFDTTQTGSQRLRYDLVAPDLFDKEHLGGQGVWRPEEEAPEIPLAPDDGIVNVDGSFSAVTGFEAPPPEPPAPVNIPLEAKRPDDPAPAAGIGGGGGQGGAPVAERPLEPIGAGQPSVPTPADGRPVDPTEPPSNAETPLTPWKVWSPDDLDDDEYQPFTEMAKAVHHADDDE